MSSLPQSGDEHDTNNDAHNFTCEPCFVRLAGWDTEEIIERLAANHVYWGEPPVAYYRDSAFLKKANALVDGDIASAERRGYQFPEGQREAYRAAYCRAFLAAIRDTTRWEERCEYRRTHYSYVIVCMR